jgi:hypothetical protein
VGVGFAFCSRRAVGSENVRGSPLIERGLQRGGYSRLARRYILERKFDRVSL